MQSRKNLPIQINCDCCGKPFLRTPSECRKTTRRGWSGLYCSRQCAYDSMTRSSSITVECDECGKQITRLKGDMMKRERHGIKHSFCNCSCAAKFRNSHKTSGSRRSKMELYLEQMIRDRFPSVEFLCNDRTAIGSELDIYFPQLKLGIELNGIFHYEPIYGESKLQRIRDNDRQKILTAAELGIELIVISNVNAFTNKDRVECWDQIEKIIDTSLRRV